MLCKDCAFCWTEQGDNFPQCHWEEKAPDDLPPCEIEDDYEEDDDLRLCDVCGMCSNTCPDYYKCNG